MDRRKNEKSFQKRSSNNLALWLANNDDGICIPGYTPLDKNPEVLTACRKIAELISSMTIHLMNNTPDGDVRIVNALSRLIDINPMPNMTRRTWCEAVVMNMLLYGKGNSVVLPKTRGGLLEKLEPISADRVDFIPIGRSDYKIRIDGSIYNPDEVLHFVFNPDKYHQWKGAGITVALKDIVRNLKQATETKKAFMESKWKPSVIISVDAIVDELSTKQGRRKILDDYIATQNAGEPWIIPAEQFNVETVKPLTLSDLAISDSVEVDKRTVAAILGVPPFVLGVGDYNEKAWNSFIANTVRPIALTIAQEMTKKLIISDSWYLKFNLLSLMDWDIKTIADVFCSLGDRGYVDGNEVRDRVGMSPRDGLNELRILENYIPTDMTGKQKKLLQEEE